jgi:hypothetical protein
MERQKLVTLMVEKHCRHYLNQLISVDFTNIMSTLCTQDIMQWNKYFLFEVFFPKIQGPHLIMKIQQTNPNRGKVIQQNTWPVFFKITKPWKTKQNWVVRDSICQYFPLYLPFMTSSSKKCSFVSYEWKIFFLICQGIISIFAEVLIIWEQAYPFSPTQ